MKLIGITNGVKVIASVSHHDYIIVDDIMHDGGQPGTSHYAGYNRHRGESIYFEVHQTFGELYTDYQYNYGKTRSYGIWNIEDVKILEELEEDMNSFEYQVSQAIWGTCGIDGDEPKKFVNLVDCSTDHLNAILETQKITYNYKQIIDHILNTRQN